jgi:hypothetical protein
MEEAHELSHHFDDVRMANAESATGANTHLPLVFKLSVLCLSRACLGSLFPTLRSRSLQGPIRFAALGCGQRSSSRWRLIETKAWHLAWRRCSWYENTKSLPLVFKCSLCVFVPSLSWQIDALLFPLVTLNQTSVVFSAACWLSRWTKPGEQSKLSPFSSTLLLLFIFVALLLVVIVVVVVVPVVCCCCRRRRRCHLAVHDIATASYFASASVPRPQPTLTDF